MHKFAEYFFYFRKTMTKIVTNNGRKGGWLKGKPHNDKDGKPLGGIKAVVVDTNKPVELENGEVIINKQAVKKHWKTLSKINQSAGNGVAITPPQMKKGGNTDKVAVVMKEFKKGELKTSAGKKVTKQKQAVAIALSEQRKENEQFADGGTITTNNGEEVKVGDLVLMQSREGVKECKITAISDKRVTYIVTAKNIKENPPMDRFLKNYIGKQGGSSQSDVNTTAIQTNALPDGGRAKTKMSPKKVTTHAITLEDYTIDIVEEFVANDKMSMFEAEKLMENNVINSIVQRNFNGGQLKKTPKEVYREIKSKQKTQSLYSVGDVFKQTNNGKTHEVVEINLITPETAKIKSETGTVSTYSKETIDNYVKQGVWVLIGKKQTTSYKVGDLFYPKANSTLIFKITEIKDNLVYYKNEKGESGDTSETNAKEYFENGDWVIVPVKVLDVPKTNDYSVGDKFEKTDNKPIITCTVTEVTNEEVSYSWVYPTGSAGLNTLPKATFDESIKDGIFVFIQTPKGIAADAKVEYNVGDVVLLFSENKAVRIIKKETGDSSRIFEYEIEYVETGNRPLGSYSAVSFEQLTLEEKAGILLGEEVVIYNSQDSLLNVFVFEKVIEVKSRIVTYQMKGGSERTLANVDIDALLSAKPQKNIFGANGYSYISQFVKHRLDKFIHKTIVIPKSLSNTSTERKIIDYKLEGSYANLNTQYDNGAEDNFFLYWENLSLWEIGKPETTVDAYIKENATDAKHQTPPIAALAQKHLASKSPLAQKHIAQKKAFNKDLNYIELFEQYVKSTEPIEFKMVSDIDVIHNSKHAFELVLEDMNMQTQADSMKKVKTIDLLR